MSGKKFMKQAGFTLIELLFVVTIVSLLLVIGVPSYNNLRNNNCLTTNTNRLVASLQYARSEAAKRNSAVSLRPRAVGGARNWRNGFEIITDEIDVNGNGTCDGIEDHDNNITNPTAGTAPGTCDVDGILKIIELGCGDPNAARGLQVTNNVVAAAAANPRFSYRSSGRLQQGSVGGTFNICMANYNGAGRGRQVRISAIGRPQTDPVDTNTLGIAVCP